MNELLDYVLQLLDYIEGNSSGINTATQKELMVFLQEVMQFIEEYHQKAPESSASPVEALKTVSGVPPLDPGPFESSNVNSYKYNPKTGQLFVKFHGKETADSGPVYSYQGIPKGIYDVFNAGRVAPKTSGQNQYHRWIQGVTPSLGASLYALIRQGGYPYQRVS